MSKFLNIALASTLLVAPAFADGFGLGRPALPEEIAAWDGDVSPDGTGLPVGSGDALIGEELFADKCASCHGDFAEGIDNWPKLAGGADTLDHDDPLKTVGSYWPHLSTAFDYIKRSMPFGEAGTLTDDEVYAMLAYILYSNDMIEDDYVLSNETFLEVEMPNAAGFILDDRLTTEHAKWVSEPCMVNCKTDVKVTMRALVLDVTPDEAATEEAAAEPVAAQVAAFDPDLAAKGEKVFKKCKSCHQIGEGAKNRSGPILTGVIGREAGAVDGFKYSKALKGAAQNGLVWAEPEMAEFLTKPKAYLKGTKMSFNGLKKDEDVAAIIEYLKSVEE
jgi:cytochrome c